MSSTFAIIVKKGKLLDLPTDEDGTISDKTEYDDDCEWIDVAYRTSGIRWLNDLAQFLPPETKVYPIDNSHQGIYTIGDIIKEINED